MKKYSAIALLVGAVSFSNAQSFSESFDSVSVASPVVASYTMTADNLWEVRNFSSTQGGTNWFQGNETVFPAHAGAGYVGANFNTVTGANTINTYLMSKVRTFNNGDTISFWTRETTSNPFPDRLILKLSTNGAGTAQGDFATTLLTINPNLTTTDYPETWTQYSVTLTGLAAPVSGRFAFNYNVTDGGPAGNNSNYIGIDSVSYEAVPEPASMTALGLGALALIRRRRNAK